MHERDLQKIIHSYLSEPSVVRQTKKGKRLQILSPGRINVHPGPDFKDMALLIESTVLIADGEFHKKSSEWNLHQHSGDSNYSKVALHIVFDDDNFVSENIDVLTLNEQEILEYGVNLKRTIQNTEFQLEDLQHYALIRLLRKAAEAQKLINIEPLEKVVFLYVKSYLDKYYSKQTRPKYNGKMLDDLLDAIINSDCLKFLFSLSNGFKLEVNKELTNLLKKKIFNEGEGLRREIIMNCILPPALCLANDESRVGLFLWYWSTPAIAKYGLLSRNFKTYSQNYIWQQQGMLEYLRLYGRKPTMVAEALEVYGFAEVLSFYKIYREPKEIEISEL